VSVSGSVGRIEQYLRLMRVDRPIGALLLLWPTLWAVWMASDGNPEPHILLIFITGVFLMRSAGCVINDYADRDMDPHVERTRDRPLAARRVSATEALILFLVLSAAALALVLMLNRLTILLSLVGAFWAVIYPFMKRFIDVPQLVLGFAFSWGIPMAFAAQIDAVPGVAWVLLAANLAWVMAYDTQYAMADREDDLAIGVKSTAILFGRFDRLMVGCFQFLTLALLVLVGRILALNLYYYGGLAVAGELFLYQQWLIRGRQAPECFHAFLNNTWAGASIFLGLVLSYL
jgi:4-hydroxybenzoate polyprenyltransferase